MKTFGQKYDVEVEVTPYNNYDQMVAKLREPGAAFDLVFPGPSVLSKIVYGELLQPLNHSYVPNLANVWPEYQDPWYDLGAQYTVPYTVYTTGVAYRADRVSSVPENGYDLLWDEQYSGKTYILDDQGEAIGMSLLRNDITTDINTAIRSSSRRPPTPDRPDRRVKVKTGISAYSLIPEGTATVHQAWSGDMIAGQYYLPKGESTDVLAYWRPEAQQRPGHRQRHHRHPQERRETGTRAPDDQRPSRQRHLVEELRFQRLSAAASPSCRPSTSSTRATSLPTSSTPWCLPADFKDGLTFYETSPSTEALWRTSWAEFKAGA